MLIGIDLDNTIIDYEDAFRTLAREWGLTPAGFQGNKVAIREYLKTLPGGHEEWMRLQGYVYGKGIHYARVMPGFLEFVRICRERKLPTVIVSHKTQYGHYDPEKVDLREAALGFMAQQGFFDQLGFEKQKIFFEFTKEEKLARIKTLECSHFIDDLVDIFTHPQFPISVKPYLLSKEKNSVLDSRVVQCCDWLMVMRNLFI